MPPGLGSSDLGSQLALIRALLSSPNGGLGTGLIGAAGGGNPLADNAPRTKALGARRGARSPVKGSRASSKVKARPRPSSTVGPVKLVLILSRGIAPNRESTLTYGYSL